MAQVAWQTLVTNGAPMTKIAIANASSRRTIFSESITSHHVGEHRARAGLKGNAGDETVVSVHLADRQVSAVDREDAIQA